MQKGESYLQAMNPLASKRTIVSPSDTRAEARRREVYERCENDIYEFIYTFLIHHFWGDVSAMHREFFKIIDDMPEGVNTAIAAPRGNNKTTIFVTALPLHAICYKKKNFIVVIGYSEADGIEKVSNIRDELLNNQRLIDVFGELLTPFAGNSNFVAKNGVRVQAKSRGKPIRGAKHLNQRPDLIIGDDIESLEGTKTPEQREKTRTWFKKDVIGAGRVDGKTNNIVVGTVLHSESLLSELLKTPGWLSKKFRSIVSFAKNEALWQKWRDIYCDLDDPNATLNARKFYEANEEAMLEGVEVAWPSETYYKLMEFEVQNGKAALFSEKQNDPFDPEKQVLDPDICPRFRVIRPEDNEWPDYFKDFNSERYKHRESGFMIVPLLEGKEPIHSSELREIVAFHDPALANSKKSDYAAICVVAQDFNDRLYLLEMFMKRVPTSQQIEAAFGLWERWGFNKLYLETQNFQQLLRDDYKQHHAAFYPHASFKIIGVTQHSDKQARIGTLEPYFANRWLYMNQNTDREFISQIRAFPTGHDDGLDALDGCKRQLRRPRGLIEQISHSNVI